MPPKVPRKPKILRSNPHHVLAYLIDNEEDDIDDWQLMPVYRRPQEFNKLRDEIDDMDLSDEVRIRLAVIRAKTLHKYRELYYNNAT